jgi:hypothetical protein
MMWPWKKWIQKEDTTELTDEMARVVSPGQTKYDIHVDFLQLFRGSPQGLRVLQKILKWGDVYDSTIPPGQTPVDVNAVLIREGQRRLALRILSTVNVEPKSSNITRTTHKEK